MLTIAIVSHDQWGSLPFTILGASLYMAMMVALIDAFSLDFLSSTSMFPKRAWRKRKILSLIVSFREHVLQVAYA